MAILGVQTVITMIVASFLSKLSPYYSLGRWLLCSKLYRYIAPSDYELHTAVGHRSKDKSKANHSSEKADTFTVPKNIEIQLDIAPLSWNDVVSLRFYSDFQWIIDLSLASVLVFLLTEVYHYFMEVESELNLSLFWCLLTIVFALKALCVVTVWYFRSRSGEGSLMVTFGFLFLVIAMAVLITSEKHLELGIDTGYKNFSDNAMQFLKENEINASGPASLLTYKIILAFVAALLGALMTFPGLRYAKMFNDSLRYQAEYTAMKALLYANFLLPALVVMAWVRPLTRDVLVRNLGPLGYYLAVKYLDIVRIYLILALCAVRLFLAPVHLQSYLNLANERFESLRKEAGRIGNRDLQDMIRGIYYYLCAVAIQYAAPTVFLLFCALMLKSTSDVAWSGGIDVSVAKETAFTDLTGGWLDDDAAAVAQRLWQLKRLFSPLWYKGLFSFFCWWTCLTSFIASCFGLLHHAYFRQ